jgi:hypothetical protein
MFDGIYKEHLDGVYVSNGFFLFSQFFTVGSMPSVVLNGNILSSLICLGIQY